MKYIYINFFYKIAGVLFLLLAKCKNVLQGYSTPRTFSLTEYDKGVKYDLSVVDNWLTKLHEYNGGKIKGKNILELGPGADLGVGLYLLHKGAYRYNAIDVNNLVASVPGGFYNHFFDYLYSVNPGSEIDILRNQLKLTQENRNDKLNYICRNDFDITSAIKPKSVDIIFSQAAFEHFDNIQKTIEQLSTVSKNGAILIALIDLKTHSRWIKDKDPNNIYRYSDWFYNIFKFRGTPNRIRPYKYKKILEKNGWHDIQIIQKKVYENNETSFLNKKFQSDKNQMELLSVYLCAVKK